MNPQKHDKWVKWLGDASIDGCITNELANLATIREVHAGLQKMIKENEKLQIHSAFYSVTHITYSQTVLMYIRRQIRRDKGSISLIQLADDLFKNHKMITKDFYSNLYLVNRDASEHEDYKEFGNKDFIRNFGNLDYVDPNILLNDINALEDISNKSSEFIDWRIAHIDKREPKIIPYMSEIEEWCDSLNNVLKRYMSLLKAVDYKVQPVLEHDWKAVFRQPWL